MSWKDVTRNIYMHLEQIKLHLGCGTKAIEGYTNIDCRYFPNVDSVDNVRFLRSLKNDTVDVIYASHVLEHFSRWDYESALERWHGILKPNGVLRLAVPDFEQIAKYYLKTKKIRDVSGMLFGGQDYPENNHFWCWDFNELKKDLNKIGFKKVKKYNWRETDHADVDDFSQAYLPYMDKDNGTLMSLNVEAIKL